MKTYECIVLTYNVPHRKTYDTLCRLKALGYSSVLVLAVDLHYKKTFKPIYEHRPPVILDIMPEVLCKNLGYEFVYSPNGYEKFNYAENIPILVCGAGIIPEEIVKRYRIINSHPGFIPLARGLDALKWSIVEKIPIGVTSHLIGNEIDAGEIIERKKIAVYSNDTFHSVAQRVYDTEIELLVGALDKLEEKHIIVSGGDNPVHKRMQKEIESNLLCLFEEYKKN